MVFGWCSADMGPGDHKKCRMAFRSRGNNQIYKCECKCHKGKKYPEVEPEFVLEPDKPLRKSRKKKTTK